MNQHESVNFGSVNEKPLDQSSDEPQYMQKIAEILDACSWRDVESLKKLALSRGGLVNDELRCKAWPLLLGCEMKDEKVEKGQEFDDWNSLPRHRDEDQVQLDVDRSFVYYPNNESTKELDRRRIELSNLIVSVLRRNPYLCYFQGYHDIAQVFLLVLDAKSSYQPVARLSALRIRDYMLPTLAPALSQLRMIPSIIKIVNPALYRHLSGTQPFFALSGTLTMYAHDIQSYGEIARLFDVLLARESVFSVYMFAAIVLSRADELFETPADEPEMLHSILSKLPKPLNLEAIIIDTVDLFEAHPPESLDTWRTISPNSVLKTARQSSEASAQTLADGKEFFHRQVAEIAWQKRKQDAIDTLWKYRRPAATVGVAVLVGILSIYLRRPSSSPR